MSRFLICNADDFGVGRGATDAIIDCHLNGIISSTTLMANMPDAGYAAICAQKTPSLGIGVHLNLTEGRPLSPTNEVRDLVDDQGFFLKAPLQKNNLWYGKAIRQQLEREITAQFERSFVLGIKPTHCDSHHGLHGMPVFREALIRVLPKLNVRGVRTQVGGYWVCSNASFYERFKCILFNLQISHKLLFRRWNHFKLILSGLKLPDRKISRDMLVTKCKNPEELLLKTLKNLPEGVSEIVFHPGLVNSSKGEREEFDEIRRIDTKLLTAPDIVSAIKGNDIKLITYKDLQD